MLVDDIKKALRILFNFNGLVIKCNESDQTDGMSIYTTFSRHDALERVPVLKGNNDLISIKANISVPNCYEVLFDNKDRSEIIPLNDLKAIEFTVRERRIDNLLRILSQCYNTTDNNTSVVSCAAPREGSRNSRSNLYSRYNSCTSTSELENNNSIIDAVTCDSCVFDLDCVYEFGISSIELSNQPVKGRVRAYDSSVFWIQSDQCPMKFYLLPINEISYILNVC